MPLVSVVLAVHDDARYLPLAVESVLRQTVDDLELIVVDDASTDETPAILDAVADRRLVVLANDEQRGLAASLNRALDQARGRYIARIDADDIALPERLEIQLARIGAEPRTAIVGAGVLDVDSEGRPQRLHQLPGGATAVRWHALFSSPFFHPAVLFDRELLEEHGLRYDPSYLESEDYDLWTRVLDVGEGDNLAEPLVLKRVHAAQASMRRGDLQQELARTIALRQIGRLITDPARAELAWRGQPKAFLELLRRFEERFGVDETVRRAAAKRLGRAGHVAQAVRLERALPARIAAERVRRRTRTRPARTQARQWLAELTLPSRPTRVAVVSPEPTPYRAPLFDRVGAHPQVELTVIYAARTVAGRTWSVEGRHRSVFLRGLSVPGMRRVLHHDYPVTPGIGRALRHARPDVVVVSGWSTFASQAGIAWCRARGIPYVLLVESHDLGPRSPWRRVVKSAVVPRVVRGATSVLAVGTLARDSVIARGASPERVRIFANTIDVAVWEERAERLARQRRKLRSALAFGDEDVVVLSVARLAPEKGIDTLVRAVAEAGDARLAIVVAGSGPQASRLMHLAEQSGARLLLTGELSEERLAEAYVAADVFALLSRREPWAVVVNEAAASGLPLVLSDQVGAARDLLRDGVNGVLVRGGDVGGTAAALGRLASDPAFRREAGARSRELVRAWGYEPSVESFAAAVREATTR